MFPPEAGDKREGLTEHGAHLALSVDLDGDRHLEKAVVGVYRDKAGSTGRFLLILAQDLRGPRKKALFAEPGPPSFSALLLKDTTLLWVFCMECDTAYAVAHKRGTWTLDRRSCCDEEAAEQRDEANRARRQR
jgi:hypothetical protein